MVKMVLEQLADPLLQLRHQGVSRDLQLIALCQALHHELSLLHGSRRYRRARSSRKGALRVALSKLFGTGWLLLVVLRDGLQGAGKAVEGLTGLQPPDRGAQHPDLRVGSRCEAT